MEIIEAYSILGITENDDLKNITRIYRNFIRKYHPDINKEPGCEEMSKNINIAYDLIKKYMGCGTYDEDKEESRADNSEYVEVDFGDMDEGFLLNKRDIYYTMMMSFANNLCNSLGKGRYKSQTEGYEVLFDTVYRNSLEGKRKNTKLISSMAEELTTIENIRFSNMYFEMAVRIHLNKATGKISSQQLNQIESLNLSNSGQISLEDLKFFKNLRELDLSFTYIDDCSPIYEIRDLESLALFKCNTHYEYNNPYLKELNIAYRQMGDLGDIGRLFYTLRYLDASDNNLNSLGEIEFLFNLEELILYKNNITDLTMLSGFDKLKRLDISLNPIKDITVLKRVPKLEYLNLNWTRVEDYSPILDFPSIKFVDVSYVSDRKLQKFESLWNELESRGVTVKKQPD